MSTSAAGRMGQWRRHLGRPFVERELGEHPQRWLGISAGLTAALAALNAAYYFWLEGRMDSPWGYLTYEETRYLEGGYESLIGGLDLQLVGLLGVALFLVAPTLASMTVAREAQARTLDMLLTSPMSALGLHNGVTLGALARLAPWLAPVLGLHVLIGVTGGIEATTLLSTTTLLLVGGWALTSLGTMFGVLLRQWANGPLAGLMIFCLFGLAFGLPIAALDEGGAEHIALISPASALAHSLATDANFLLSRIEHGPELFYDGRLLGLPIQTTLFCLPILLFFGLISTHVSARKLSDALAPPLDARVSVGAMAFVVLTLAMLVSQELPASDWWGLDDSEDSTGMFGRQLLIAGFVLNVLAFPWLLTLCLGAVPSAAFLERARLWSATRPADLGLRGRGVSVVKLFVALAALPFIGAALMPLVTTDLPMSPMTANFSNRLAILIPMLLALGAVLEIIRIWRLTGQRHWQTGLAIAAIAAAAIAGSVYSVIIIDEDALSLRDFAFGRDLLSLVLSMTLMVACVLAPFVLALWRTNMTHEFDRYLEARIQKCERADEAPTASFQWPRPRIAEGERQCQLRPSLLAPSEGLDGWLLGARASRKASLESWLMLREAELLAWTGSADGHDAPRTLIDMTRPFTVAAALQPLGDNASVVNPSRRRLDVDRADAVGDGVDRADGVTLNITLTQRRGDGPDDIARIAFAVPVRYSAALERLPIQDQRLDRLGPRDAQPLLAALRYYADAAGIPLPA